MRMSLSTLAFAIASLARCSLLRAFTALLSAAVHLSRRFCAATLSLSLSRSVRGRRGFLAAAFVLSSLGASLCACLDAAGHYTCSHPAVACIRPGQTESYLTWPPVAVLYISSAFSHAALWRAAWPADVSVVHDPCSSARPYVWPSTCAGPTYAFPWHLLPCLQSGNCIRPVPGNAPALAPG